MLKIVSEYDRSKKSKLYGLKDETGELIVPCKYDHIMEEASGYFLTVSFTKDSGGNENGAVTYGLIDPSGKTIFLPKYDNFHWHSNEKNTKPAGKTYKQSFTGKCKMKSRPVNIIINGILILEKDRKGYIVDSKTGKELAIITGYMRIDLSNLGIGIRNDLILVETSDGECGYFNANENSLKTFDESNFGRFMDCTKSIVDIYSSQDKESRSESIYKNIASSDSVFSLFQEIVQYLAALQIKYATSRDEIEKITKRYANMLKELIEMRNKRLTEIADDKNQKRALEDCKEQALDSLDETTHSIINGEENNV